jgi:hypothetical protein
MMSFAGDAGDCGVSFTTTRKNGRDSDSLNIWLETSPAIPRIPRSHRPEKIKRYSASKPGAEAKGRDSCIDLAGSWPSYFLLNQCVTVDYWGNS